jgi:ParB/RepB/Spo0J family partition protein
MTQIQMIKLAHIEPSTTNPRKHFDKAALEDLAASIRGSGVHQPVLVRRLPAERVPDTSKHVQWELVFGERRYRASKLAGVDSIPAMVREMTDAQVLEAQVVENLQREDLSPMDEAEGYQTLMQRTDISADDVAAKIGKSRSYVYARLKLMDLCEPAKQALRDGKIDASRALLIARVHDTKLQEKTLAEATRDNPPSVRELQVWMGRHVLLNLTHAPFPTNRKDLTPAGACTTCPNRTGANPDLFAVDALHYDMCLQSTCYQAKDAAWLAYLQDKADTMGARLIAGKEAKNLFQWGSEPKGYSRITQVRKDFAGVHNGDAPTLGVLLGKKPPGLVAIVHPITGELIKAVPTAETEALLIERGLVHVGEDGSKTGTKGAIEDLNKNLPWQIKQARAKARCSGIVKGILPLIAIADDATIFEIFRAVGRQYLMQGFEYQDDADIAAIINRPGENVSREDGAEWLEQACTEEILAALLVAMCIEDMGTSIHSSSTTPVLNALINVTGINTQADQDAAEVQVKAETMAKLNEIKAQAKAKTPPAKNDPLALAHKGAGKGKPKKAGLMTGGAKLSEKEAITGIAEAMQGIEQPPGADALSAAEGQASDAGGEY